MSSGLVVGPAWVAAEGGGYVGQNPLAVGRHVLSQSRKFAIAGTSTTFHARYYTLHGLVAAEADDRGLSRDDEIDLLRRCEVVFAAVAAAHRTTNHADMLNIHGINAIGSSLDQRDEVDLTRLAGHGPGAYTQRRWGFMGDYASPEENLGLVVWREGRLVPGPGLDVGAVREGLGALLDLARRDVVDRATLESHADLCICRTAQSADGRALRTRLLAENAGPMSWEGRSSQTIRMLLRLLDLRGGATGSLQDDLGPFLLFDPRAQQDSVLAGLAATSAWQGLVLREVSVRAWHRLWAWLVGQIDGATTIEALADALADELPDGTLGQFVQNLPERRVDARAGAGMLPAEQLVEEDDQYRTFPDRQLAKLILGALRMAELPDRVAAYFEDPVADGRSRLRPGWVRTVIEQWRDRPMRDLAVFLTSQLVSRAQQVALSKARFDESTGIYEVPSGVSLREGVVVCDYAGDQSIHTWFRWNAIARILAGVGLTEQVDGQWRVTEEGRLP